MSAAEFYFYPIEQIFLGWELKIHTECIYRLEGYIHETYRNEDQEAEKIWTFHLKDGRPSGLISNSSADDLRESIRKERKSKAYHTMANEFHFVPIEDNQAGHYINCAVESVYRLDGYFGQPFSDEGRKEDIKNWQLTGPNGVQLDQSYRGTVEEMREIILKERSGQSC
jgi:hypothetical protein